MAKATVPPLRPVLVVGQATTILTSRVEVAPAGTGQTGPEVEPRRSAGGGAPTARVRAKTVPGIVPTGPLAEAFGRVATAGPGVDARDGGVAAGPATLDALPSREVGPSGPATEATTATATSTTSVTSSACSAPRAPAGATRARRAGPTTTKVAVVGPLPRGVTTMARTAMAAPSGGVHGPSPLALAAPRPVGASPGVARVGLKRTPPVLNAAKAVATPVPMGGAPVPLVVVPQVGPPLPERAVARLSPLGVAQTLTVRATRAVAALVPEAAGLATPVHQNRKSWQSWACGTPTKKQGKNGTLVFVERDSIDRTCPPL